MAKGNYGRGCTDRIVDLNNVERIALMTTTIRQSDGNLTIEQAETAVSTFESGFAKFLGNELSISATKKTNKTIILNTLR